MFQIKDFRSIVASMINVSRAANSKITDYSVGSVARTLMEAPAIEIEELYLQMLLGLQEAIPVSVFTSFDFSRLPAVAASGTVRFACESSTELIIIPAGTRIKSANLSIEYLTKSDAFIQAGSTYTDVSAACASTGAFTNCAAGTLTAMVMPISGVTSVANLVEFGNGADIESDSARKSRFQHYVTTLSRGTVSALRYGASQSTVSNQAGDVIEVAEHVAIIEPYLTNAAQPVGLVSVYLHNGVGATSGDLISAVSKNLHGYTASDGTLVPGWKAAGVQVNVYAATEVAINITASIVMIGGSSNVQALVLAKAATDAYLLSLGIGEDVIQSELVASIMSIDGIYNVTMSTPLVDVVITSTQKAMPGAAALS